MLVFSKPSNFYKWQLVFFLWFSHFFNQADRQVYNVLIKDISEDITMTEVQAGLIASAFLLVYGVLTPIAGFIGDLISRKKIIVGALFFWSLATVLTGCILFLPTSVTNQTLIAGVAEGSRWHMYLASGITTGFLLLLFLRSMATGAGEAFYYPSANAILSQYHPHTRATAMSAHQSALYVGIIFSSGLAGWICMKYDAWAKTQEAVHSVLPQHGWQVAFMVFGFLGLLLALILTCVMRNDRKDREAELAEKAEQEKATAVPPKFSLGRTLYTIFSRPTVLALWIGLATFNVVGLAFMTWMPTLLQNDFQMNAMSAGLAGTTPHFICAILGVMFGGWFSDRMVKRYKKARILLESVSLLICAPFILLMAYAIHQALTGNPGGMTLTYCMIGMAGYGFFRGIYDSNLFACMFDFIPVEMRSSASGLLLSVGAIVGAIGPTALPVLKKMYDSSVAMGIMAGVIALGGVVIAIALLLFFHRDYCEE